MNIEEQYLELIHRLHNRATLHGWRDNRTGVPTVSVFGVHLRHDMADGFPLLTTKRVHWPSVMHELLWFLRGESNIAYLKENKVRIWDEWADEGGNLGPVYGVQWRSWPTPDGQHIDQVQRLIDGLRSDPHSRRHIVSAWNVGELDAMALPPCHMMFQCHVGHDARLHLQMYQRSADAFLGLPFNIASYALLLRLLAHCVGLDAGTLTICIGDAHIYENHQEQTATQLFRDPYQLPALELQDAPRDIDAITAEHIHIHDYRHHGALPGKVAV